jgi:hypothetical protein
VTGFLVEVYTPAAAALAEIQKLNSVAKPARYVRSIVVPGDETCFHLFEAASAEVVLEASRRAGITPQRIVEAVEANG